MTFRLMKLLTHGIDILDFHLSILNGSVSSKIYDKSDDFDFDIVNFSFLDGDIPCTTSYSVNISQRIRLLVLYF